jgi:TRAP-type C4-dicarboxylate transport system permease large subunit
MATVMGATAFKSICGSSAATSATFASVAIPEMKRYGYDPKLSAGIVATVGTLGVIIPPSVTLIILGILTEQSIGQLFLAGIIPGLIIALFFIGIIYGWAKINPAIAPMSQRYAWKARMRSLPEMFWVLLIFGRSSGLSRLEAGAVGTFAVLLLAIIRDMTLKGMSPNEKGVFPPSFSSCSSRIYDHGLSRSPAFPNPQRTGSGLCL